MIDRREPWSFWLVGCLCDNKMRQDINSYVDMEHKTARTIKNNACIIRTIANLAINKGRIKDLDTLKTMEGPHTSADALYEYIVATSINDGH